MLRSAYKEQLKRFSCEVQAHFGLGDNYPRIMHLYIIVEVKECKT